MDQHPMPRQITTFEFKLIGFLTLKQFIYLVIFIPLGFIVYKLVAIPLVNILLAALVGAGGVAFAFIPVNDRPLDVWIKNMAKRLTSPTQYVYKKKNAPIYFLKNLFFVSDPHRVMTHIESQEKLAAYLAKTKVKATAPSNKKKAIATLLAKPKEALIEKKNNVPGKPAGAPAGKVVERPITQKKPFFSGVIKNHRLIPLPGILIYVKDEKGAVLRLLKTNPHGIFATFNPLSPSEYIFEFKDPKNTYFFDTIKLNIEESNPKPLEFFSKELL